MKHAGLIVAVIVIQVLIAIAFWAWDKCHLGSLSRKTCPPSGGSSFVGAMADQPWQVPCAFGEKHGWHLNRCNYA